MAQLLRIQPAQAQVNPQMPEDGHYIQKGFQRLGADIADTFERIQVAADVTEGDRISAQLAAEVKNTIRQKALETADPDEFDTSSNDAVTKLRDTHLANASPNVKNRVLNRTAGVFADAAGDIKFQAAQKRVKIAEGNSLIFLEQKEREFMDAATPEERAQKQSEIEAHLIDATRAHVYTPVTAKKTLGNMLERQAFIQAKSKLDTSMNPTADYATLARDFPHLDRMKIANELNTVAQSREREMTAIQKEAARVVKEEYLSLDYQRAISGKMSIVEFESVVKTRRYNPAEANSIKAAMEEGGITDPNVSIRLENDILEGRLRNQSQIATNRNLDRATKSRLMGLIESQIRQDRSEALELKNSAKSNHFSESPEYKQAVREYRAAISGKGESSPLDDKENIRYNFGLKQLWERSEKGESPLNVAREIESRLTPKEMAGSPPIIMPKYTNDTELIEARRRGQITEAIAAQEAELMMQWERWRNKVASSIQTPQQQGQQSGGRKPR